jgi:hypothetical protein
MVEGVDIGEVESPVAPTFNVEVPPGYAHIPDISYFTAVSLPQVLDLKNRPNEAVGLLSQLVEEEQTRDPNYLGCLLYGSIVNGKPDNSSDIDVVHVFRKARGSNVFEYKFEGQGIKSRLRGIFEFCYGVTVQDTMHTIVLDDPGCIDSPARLFDRYTRSIGINDEEVEKIRTRTNYHKRQKHSGFRFPAMSKGARPPDPGPHKYKYPQSGLFPLTVKWGLESDYYKKQ